MGFRFRKSFKIAPGVRLNLSKTGVSASIGVKGATLNSGSQGMRVTASAPGTGLSVSERVTKRQTPYQASQQTTKRADPDTPISSRLKTAALTALCVLITTAFIVPDNLRAPKLYVFTWICGAAIAVAAFIGVYRR